MNDTVRQFRDFFVSLKLTVVLILLIVVFLFGARRIPEIARGLGEGIRGFRTSLKGDDSEAKSSDPGDTDRFKG